MSLSCKLYKKYSIANFAKATYFLDVIYLSDSVQLSGLVLPVYNHYATIYFHQTLGGMPHSCMVQMARTDHITSELNSLTFSMLVQYMLKDPLKWLPAVSTGAHFSEYLNN